jgi:GDP-L-fucose synthase
MEQTSRIYVAGHSGLVGSALMRLLVHEGYDHISTASSKAVDLRSQAAVNNFFQQERPEYIFLAAARVGGILANDTYPADFLYDNLMITTNVIHAAHTYQARKLLFLGSSCIYPRLAPQPMKEEMLLSGQLEPTNEWYALAKIAGVKLCQAYMRQYAHHQQKTTFIAAMPTNLYGIGDRFDLKASHVIPALIIKFCEAVAQGRENVVIWGSGTPLREFLYVDDLARALLLLMKTYDDEQLINIGSGMEYSIAGVAHTIARVVGFTGRLVFDTTMPDGVPRKLVESARIQALDWRPEIGLIEGLTRTIDWYQEQYQKGFYGQTNTPVRAHPE